MNEVCTVSINVIQWHAWLWLAYMVCTTKGRCNMKWLVDYLWRGGFNDTFFSSNLWKPPRWCLFKTSIYWICILVNFFYIPSHRESIISEFEGEASWGVHDSVCNPNVFDASSLWRKVICAHLCLQDFSSVTQRQPDVGGYADLFLVCSFNQGYQNKTKQNCPSGVPEDVWQFVKATSIFKTKYWTWMLGEISKHIHFCQAQPLWTGEVHCFYLPMINFWWGREDHFLGDENRNESF